MAKLTLSTNDRLREKPKQQYNCPRRLDKNKTRLYNILVRDSRTVAWAQAYEESPSTTEQECRLTACEGDFKESATEIYRNACVVRVEMRGKSPHTFWWQCVHVNPTRCKKWEQMPARHLDILAGDCR